jgi:methyl-accepting chemotaxis protein
VADEIAKLADTTRISVQGIEKLVKESDGVLGASAQHTSEAGKGLDLMSGHIKDIDVRMKTIDSMALEQMESAGSIDSNMRSLRQEALDIKSATQEQRSAASEINQSMQDIVIQTDNQARITEELAEIAQKLRQQSKGLEELLARFVTGGGAS